MSIRGLTLLVLSPALYTTLIPLAMTDARSADRMGNYTKFWDKDREHERSEVQGARVDNYTELVNGLSYPHLTPTRTRADRKFFVVTYRLLRWGY